MTKEEFLSKLEDQLSDMPEKDREDALKYYADYIDDAGLDEETSISELGSPESVAATIRSESGDAIEPKPLENPPVDANAYVQGSTVPGAEAGNPSKKRMPAWAIVLITVLSPVMLALGIVALVLLFVLIVLVITLCLLSAVLFTALLIAGIVALVMGVSMIVSFPAAGLLSVGSGFVCLALSALALILTVLACGRFLPGFFKLLFLWTKKNKTAEEV